MLITAFNIALNISSLLFLIFMMIVYFSKKNMNNIDNTLYKLLLIFNLLHSGAHLLYLVVQWFQIGNYSLMVLLIKSYLVPLQCYLIVLMLYIVYTLKADDKEFVNKIQNNKRKYFYYLLLVFLFELLVSVLLNFKIIYKDGFVNGSNDPLMNFYYMPFVLLVILNVAAIFLYRHKKDQKKILPFKVMLVFIVVQFTLAGIYPAIGGTEFLATIISYLMFHTIENPDLKLVNQLELAKSEAEKASNAKSEFLSSMSHELRTPLNAIVGLSDLIKNTTQEDETRSDAEDIYKASNNLLDLVDGILDINKLDSNEVEIVNANYNPLELFNHIIESMKTRVGDKEVEIRTKISKELPTNLYGDKDKLKTIINNLLSNAIKYTEKGYVELNVECVIIKEKCNLRITVSDTGRGIRNDQKEFLFTKFYRLEEDKDSDISGTGLGLAITKSLVELLDGEISVNSTEGMGSIFTVTLTQKLSTEQQNTKEEIL